ncbi:HD-GYP domain-containing protein [Jeotgalibaca porci]|uniref:HD-GYP domain-containing protein n=1 Tax=Jeotgalibaca porci TaxID=1868793 RepID=UPI00359FF190
MLATNFGLAYSHKSPVYLFLMNLIFVIIRFLFIPIESLSLGVFITRVLTYYVTTVISATLMQHALKIKNNQLELIKALSTALDYRDTYTMNHSLNVARYAVSIAEEMNLSRGSIDSIRTGALLHDIGKIGIPEHILMKNGKLTDEEYKTIQSHPEIGYQMINHIDDYRKNGVLDIVRYHHERYDGTGYPEGLKGRDIPLFARIVAVADAFDAMTSKRVYRDEFDMAYTLDQLVKNKSKQFDPEITDAFLNVLNRNKEFKINEKTVSRSILE